MTPVGYRQEVRDVARIATDRPAGTGAALTLPIIDRSPWLTALPVVRM
jgi:hypothetical protein